MSKLFGYMKTKPEIIHNSFKESGIFSNAVFKCVVNFESMPVCSVIMSISDCYHVISLYNYSIIYYGIYINVVQNYNLKSS